MYSLPPPRGRSLAWDGPARRSFRCPCLEVAGVEHLDLVFDRLQLVAAERQQGRPALVAGQQLVQRKLPGFEGRDQLFEFGQAGLVGGRKSAGVGARIGKKGSGRSTTRWRSTFPNSPA